MVNIIKSSRELTKKELYKMTVAQKKPLSETEGSNVTIDCWCLYQRENSEGETVDVLAIADTDGTIYATSSQACINSFKEMVEMLDGDFSIIKVTRRTSKQNRDYFVIELID